MASDKIHLPELNPVVGQPQVNSALASAVMAAQRPAGSFNPTNQYGAVAPPTFNQNYAQQYGNLTQAMMDRYPGQLTKGGSVFASGGQNGTMNGGPPQGMPAPQMQMTPEQQAAQAQQLHMQQLQQRSNQLFGIGG